MDTSNERASIWSVSDKWTWVYFTIFAFQVVAATVLAVWQEGFSSDYFFIASYMDIGVRVSSVILSIVAWSMMVILILEVIRVIAERYLRRRFAEGRVEGQAEVHKRWLAWLRRKEEAERKDEPFDEPPPIDEEQIQTAS